MAGIFDLLSQAFGGGAQQPAPTPDFMNGASQTGQSAPAANAQPQPATPDPQPQSLYQPNLISDPAGHFTVHNFLGNLGDALLQGAGHQPIYAPRIQQQQQASAISQFLADPNPVPSPEAISRLAKFAPDMASSMYEKAQAARMAMVPKYTKDDSGNVWKEAFGQPPVLVSKGPGKITDIQPGHTSEAINPYGLAAGGDGAAAPESADANAAAPGTSQQLPTGDQVASLITQQYPGAKVKSGLRTAAENAAVGGVSNSAHLQDTPNEWARDFHVPDGTDPHAMADAINSQGIAGLKALYEGPGANHSTAPHVHVQYIAPNGDGGGATPAAAPQATQFSRVLARGPQEWRDPTPAELEAHPGVSQVNGGTGEIKYTPQSSIPPDQNQVKGVAKAIAKYAQAPITGFALTKPYGQQVMAEVMELNPQYQAEEFPARSAAYKAFKTGPQGNLVRSFNVGISHLNSLQGLTAALGNGDVQLFNKIGQTVAEQTGKTAPTNFDAAKAIVGDEIIKAIVGGGGALADRENAQNQISRAKSPQQLLGVIQTYKTLMAGQLSGLSRQYQNATGRNDFDQLLAPETKAELEKHASAPQGPKPGTVQQGYRFNGGNPADPHSWTKV